MSECAFLLVPFLRLLRRESSDITYLGLSNSGDLTYILYRSPSMEYNSTFFLAGPAGPLDALSRRSMFAGQAMALVLKPKSASARGSRQLGIDQGPTQAQISSERSPFVRTKPDGQNTLPQTNSRTSQKATEVKWNQVLHGVLGAFPWKPESPG